MNRMTVSRAASTLFLLVIFAACADRHPPSTALTGPEASEAAIELIMAELSDARTLEVSSKLHGQTVEERIDHLSGLLQWFAGQDNIAADDTTPTPRIDTVFTLVALEVREIGPDPGLPEMMSGKIVVYTKASVSGAIAHVTKWDYGLYVDQYKVPEHLAYEYVDAAASNELLTEIGCFYQPNETGLPNERVDYWAFAKTHHVFIVREPRYYREDRWTQDLEDTRNPTPSPVLVPCPPSGF